VGPRASLDAVAKRKNFLPATDGNRIPVVYPVAVTILTELPQLLWPELRQWKSVTDPNWSSSDYHW